MKNNKKLVMGVIAFLAIGFAAVSTTLYLTGTLNIGANLDDYDVYFSNAKVNGVEDKSVITDDTHITFEASLKDIGEEYELEYFITNGSRNYDSAVSMNCTSTENEYLSITNTWVNPTTIEATNTLSGVLKATMTKGYVEEEETEIEVTCNITADAVSRTTLGDGTPMSKVVRIPVTAVNSDSANLNATSYEITGTVKDELLNKLVETNLIDDVSDVTALIEVQSDSFDNFARATFDVSSIAEDGDKVVILHFNEETEEWEFIAEETVTNGKVIADFSSFSPVAFVVKKPDGTYEIVYQSTLLTGKEVNTIIKSLVSSGAKYSDPDQTITSIVFNKVSELPNNGIVLDEEGNSVVTLDNSNVVISTLANRIDLNADSSYLFTGFQIVNNLQFNDLISTSKVTNMSSMFEGFSSKMGVTNLNMSDISDWDTSKVTSAVKMFCSFGNYHEDVSFDLTNWDVSSLEDATSMFLAASMYATNVDINLSGWNLSSIDKMVGMFSAMAMNTNSLKLNISNWKINGASNISNLCQTLGMSAKNVVFKADNFSLINVTNVASAFSNVASYADRAEIYMDKLVINNVNDASSFFSSTVSYSKDGLISMSNASVTDVDNASSFFYNFGYNYNSTSIKMNDWNINNVDNGANFINNLFNKCIDTSISMDRWTFSSIGDLDSFMQGTFSELTNSSLEMNDWSFDTITKFVNATSAFGRKADNSIYNMNRWTMKDISSLNNLFSNSFTTSKLTTINMNSWEIINIPNVSNIFYYGFTSSEDAVLNVRYWNLGNATNMDNIFASFGSFFSPVTVNGLNTWDTSKITSMNRSFNTHNDFKNNIDLSSWNVSRVTSHTDFSIGNVIEPNWVN